MQRVRPQTGPHSVTATGQRLPSYRPKLVPRRMDADVCDCGRLVYRGLDDDLVGIPVVVDHGPLTALGEFWAIRAGRLTYTVERNALQFRDRHRMVVYRQDVWRVVAGHRCDWPPLPPGSYRVHHPETKRRKEIPDEPEF